MTYLLKSKHQGSKSGFKKLVPFMISLSIWIFLANCKTGSNFIKPKAIPDDRHKISKPKPSHINIIDDIFEKQSHKVENSIDLSRQLRYLFGNLKQAMNVDAFDEVLDSSWFTDRNAKKRMTLEEIALGPNTLEGPDTSADWTIFQVKAEGVTVGFNIEDSRGDKYVIKFDPIGYSEMQSGAEIVSSKLFHAAGYYVPENYIVYFNPDILKLGQKVDFKDRQGQDRFMNQHDLDEILKKIEYQNDGRLRATASKYLSDNPDNFLGPFKYVGTRNDDPNDFIPHEHRRDLRGLRVMAAWLNHFDTKANNTLDIFADKGYVKHYLIDFGSTLGSNGDEPMPPSIGFDTSFSPAKIFKDILSLGIDVKPWEKPIEIYYRSIGHFTSIYFHPQKYKFILPNPAFENMTNRDGYWGAKLVMSFTDEQLKAAVAAGQYSDPDAAEYLLQTLIERRNIIGRYWFDKMPPLDKFELRQSSEDIQELCFLNLAVETGLEELGQSEYRYYLKNRGGRLYNGSISEYSLCIPLTEKQLMLKNEAGHKNPSPNEYVGEIKIQVKRKNGQEWSKWVKIYLGYNNSEKQYTLLGIIHQD